VSTFEDPNRLSGAAAPLLSPLVAEKVLQELKDAEVSAGIDHEHPEKGAWLEGEGTFPEIESFLRTSIAVPTHPFGPAPWKLGDSSKRSVEDQMRPSVFVGMQARQGLPGR